VTTRGKQMPPVLNAMGIACACCGNHDFNFGVDGLLRLRLPVAHLQHRRRAHDAEGGRLADGLRAHVVEVPGGGAAGEGATPAAEAPLRFGLIGLVESE
jgi:5'-nucleotidase